MKRLPKGFGKNYFSLSAITATTNHVTMHAQTSRTQQFHTIHHSSEELEALAEDEELTTLLANTLELSLKPCHCNCYFNKRTKKAIKLHPKQKFQPHIFVSLNTSVSPP